MGAEQTKEKKPHFQLTKLSENEKRAKLGLGPLPEKVVEKGKPEIVEPSFGKGYYGGRMRGRGVTDEVPMSPVVFSFDTPDSINENIFGKNLLKKIEEEKNYGWLPVELIHHLLVMMNPKDLLSCMMTCRLVNRIATTNFFWKTYYHHYYDESQKLEGDGMRIKDENFNWKKQFFKRFSAVATDMSMRKKWNPERLTSEELVKEMTGTNPTHPAFGGGVAKFQFLVYGKDGIGKKSLVRRLVDEEYDESSPPTTTHEATFKTSPAKVTSPNQQISVHPNVFGRGRLVRRGAVGTNLETICRVIVDNDTIQKDPSSTDNNNTKRASPLEGLIRRMETGGNPGLSQNNGFFLCFDVSDESSFQFLTQNETLLGDLQKIEGLRDGGYNTPKGQHRFNVIVIGLKSDTPMEERRVPREDVRVFVKKNNFKGYVEVSSKNNCNVFLPFALVLEKVTSKRIKSSMMYRTEMPARPPTKIKFNPMHLTQRVI